MDVTTKEQKERLQNKAGLKLFAGLVGTLLGNYLIDASGNLPALGILGLFTFFVLSPILLVLGCMDLCVARGQSRWMCLVGFLWCIGIAIVYAMPDKNKDLPSELDLPGSDGTDADG